MGRFRWEGRAAELTDAVNEWVVFASNEGMIERDYDYCQPFVCFC